MQVYTNISMFEIVEKNEPSPRVIEDVSVKSV